MNGQHKINRGKREKSVFRTILVPLSLLLLLEAIILVLFLMIGGVFPQLNQNTRDILDKQVSNRRNYLQNQMTEYWADIGDLAEGINAKAQNLVDMGDIDLDKLGTDSDEGVPLLLTVTENMIATMYRVKASGIYIVFNTSDLDFEVENATYHAKPGLRIRDLDPQSNTSKQYYDLLLECAPIEVVKAMHISTDTRWNTRFEFSAEHPYDESLRKPFMAAYRHKEKLETLDYGCWSVVEDWHVAPGTYTLDYSVPLMLRDGTVYGVLGVEQLSSYLLQYMPIGELGDVNGSNYILARTLQEENAHTINADVGISSGNIPLGNNELLTMRRQADGSYIFNHNNTTYVAAVHKLGLYSSYVPFENENWLLIGARRQSDMYAFSQRVMLLLIVAVLLMLAAGSVGSILIGRRISSPIRRLSQEVMQAQQMPNEIPQLSQTGIQEIDSFSGAFTSLSQNVVKASTRFLRIMEMASVDIGGCEFALNSHDDNERVFVTDNYFPLFGMEGIDVSRMTRGRLRELRRQVISRVEEVERNEHGRLIRVPLEGNSMRYLRVQETRYEEQVIVLIEDVTASTMERLRIEHERDYDLLTGLYNRRAFYRAAERLFDNPRELRCGALVMMDLDCLKKTNDTFGHEWGDRYIRQAGVCFSKSVPLGTLLARVSGDEFVVFFCGYHSRKAVQSAVNGLIDGIEHSEFQLPDGTHNRIKVSGGIAWYPQDSTDLKELIKFADFAMYRVKHGEKGRFLSFDSTLYQQEQSDVTTRSEFSRIMQNEMLSYVFQPIVDARDGSIYAYEALMRVDSEHITRPDEFIRMAGQQGRLSDIERITWFKAVESFRTLVDQNMISPHTRLFINSIGSQRMSLEDRQELFDRYGQLQTNIVIEITDIQGVDSWMNQNQDIESQPFGVELALDNYGSGYNCDKHLLDLQPKYVKVDAALISAIDTDDNKRQIVSNLIAYAHERGMQVVAEGVETLQELHALLELNVDLLQGYYLAMPMAIPEEVNAQALAAIRSYAARR